MGAFESDVRYAARTLRRNPAFTLVAALTLAIGIAANTAVFSLVDAILFEPLPYPHADRIVMLVNTWSGRSSPIEASNRFEILRGRQSLDLASAYRVVGVNLNARGEAAQVLSLQVTEDFFRLFGASIGPGRAFNSGDFRDGAANVVILTRGFWQRQFGRDPRIVGATVEIDQRPVTVAGVVGDNFDAETLPCAVRRICSCRSATTSRDRRSLTIWWPQHD